MTPFFSIIIPVYNVAPWLRECLNSVLNQSFTNWEAICVDDGSTDDSGKILDEYAKRDSRYKVIHKPNGGVSSARNVALDVARGNWIMFLDGDDCYSTDALLYINSLVANRQEIQIVSYKTYKFIDDEILHPIAHDLPSCELIDISSRIDDVELLSYFAGKAYLRTICGNLRFDERLSNGEDVLFVTQVMMRACYVCKTTAELYLYRRRDTSVTIAKPRLKFFIDYSILAPIYYMILENATKRIPNAVIINRSLRFTEVYIYKLQYLSVDDQQQAYTEWIKMSKAVRNIKIVPLRFRIIFGVCSILKLRCVAYIANVLPLLLRKKMLEILKGFNQ